MTGLAGVSSHKGVATLSTLSPTVLQQGQETFQVVMADAGLPCLSSLDGGDRQWNGPEAKPFSTSTACERTLTTALISSELEKNLGH